MRFSTKLVALALTFAVSLPAIAQEITGAGATFPYPIYSKWSDAYRNQTGVKLNYQSIGSGGGIAQIGVHPAALRFYTVAYCTPS